MIEDISEELLASWSQRKYGGTGPRMFVQGEDGMYRIGVQDPATLPPQFNRMTAQGAAPISPDMPIPDTTAVGEFIDKNGKDILDTAALVGAMVPVPAIQYPAAAYLAADAAAKGDMIGMVGNALIPAVGKLGVALGAATAVMGPDSAQGKTEPQQ